MPGYTPNYNFPYPLGGDPIQEGHLQMKNLADAVDLALNGAVIPTPPEAIASWSAITTGWYSVPNNSLHVVSAPWTVGSEGWDSMPNGLPQVYGGYVQVRRSGIYQLSLHVPWQSNTNGVRAHMILRNGTSDSNAIDLDEWPATSANRQGRCDIQAKLAAGDLLRVMLYQSSGAALNVFHDGQSPKKNRFRFSGTWLRPSP